MSTAEENLLRGLRWDADAALTRFLSVWTLDPDLLNEMGPRLTCTETDAMVCLLLSFGRRNAAKGLLEHHCREDDDGDAESHVLYRNELLDNENQEA